MLHCNFLIDTFFSTDPIHTADLRTLSLCEVAVVAPSLTGFMILLASQYSFHLINSPLRPDGQPHLTVASQYLHMLLWIKAPP